MGISRQPHKLKANKTSVFPSRLIFFDCETAPEEIDSETTQHNLKLGEGCFYQAMGNKRKPREDYFSFTSASEFWDYSMSKVTSHQRVIFMAHNLDFDFLVLHGLTELKKRNWYGSHLILTGNVDIWTFVQYEFVPDSEKWKQYEAFHKKKPRVVKSITFLDTMNYFKMSLAALGETIGLPKMEIDFKTCSDKYLADYCHNDVKIMVEAWKQWIGFLKTHNLGVWGKTLPSQAFNAFRHRFMSHDIYIHSELSTLELERKAYHGGRVECFQLGEYTNGPYYLLDINSMYPTVMKYREYPISLLGTMKQGSIDAIKKHVQHHCVIAHVLVESYRSAFPYKLKGRLIFPTGRFWAHLTTSELIQALDHREIREVKQVAIYDTAPIFSDYVDFFYTKKVEFKGAGNKAYTLLTKLFLNSLYGKFGQKIETFATIGEDEKHDLNFWSEWSVTEQKWISFRKINGKIEVSESFEEAYNSFPAVAAHVTAYARLMLHQLIQVVPRYSLFYCDTDSLIVDGLGYDKLKQFCHETDLGALHLEKQSDRINIYNVKDYVFGDLRKTKGVRRTADKLGDHKFGQWQQVSLKAVLREGKADNCQWRHVTKNYGKDYSKGVIFPDGLTLPLTLWES